MIFVHELFARQRLQHAAFTAHGFAYKEGLGLGMVQARGMKLNELHIGYGGARPVRHCHTITRGYVRVGSVKVHLAAATRRQQRYGRGKRLDFAAFFIKVNNCSRVRAYINCFWFDNHFYLIQLSLEGSHRVPLKYREVQNCR